MSLTIVDFIIIGLSLVIAALVAIRGFFDEVSRIFGYVLGFFVALIFTSRLSLFLQKQTGMQSWLSAGISYISIFLLTFILIKVLGSGFQKLLKAAKLEVIDHILGFVIGIFEAFILIGFLMTVLSLQKFIDTSSWIKGSVIFEKVINPVFSSVSSYISNVASGI